MRDGMQLRWDASASYSHLEHTPGHVKGKCPACDVQRALSLQAITPALTFDAAAKIYGTIREMDSQPGSITARYVRRNTEKAFWNQVKSVSLFYGDTKLEDIGWYNMKAYQRARVAGDPPFLRYRRPQDAKPRTLKDGTVLPAKGKTACAAKPQQVNQEMQLVKRIKVFAGCWTADDDKWFRYLQEEKSDFVRALNAEQQHLWLDMCRARERWNLILWWCLVAFHTTMSTNELRGLRLGDVHLRQELIVVPWPCAKNKGRKRSITIDDPDAMWALEQLLERARALGSIEPQHYLFPAWNPRANIYEPTKAMSESGLKKKWQEIREATGLVDFRPYDTRHTGITRVAEEGVPIDIIMRRAGHLSEEMRQHYTQISDAAQRRWLRGGPDRGYRRPPASVRSYDPRSRREQSWAPAGFAGQIPVNY